VAELALRTQSDRPSQIVPLLYRYRFTGPAEKALVKRIDELEAKLHFKTARGPLKERFFRFQRELLTRLAERNTVALDEVNDANYFEQQERFVKTLVRRMEETFRLAPQGDIDQRLRRLKKTMRVVRRSKFNGETRFREGMAKLDMLTALHRFDRATYGDEILRLEDLAETLTRQRTALVRGSLIDGLKGFMPFGCAPRQVHVRVLEPLQVTRDGSLDLKADAARVLEAYRQRMCEGLAAMDEEFREEDHARGVENRFAAKAHVSAQEQSADACAETLLAA